MRGCVWGGGGCVFPHDWRNRNIPESRGKTRCFMYRSITSSTLHHSHYNPNPLRSPKIRFCSSSSYSTTPTHAMLSLSFQSEGNRLTVQCMAGIFSHAESDMARQGSDKTMIYWFADPWQALFSHIRSWIKRTWKMYVSMRIFYEVIWNNKPQIIIFFSRPSFLELRKFLTFSLSYCPRKWRLRGGAASSFIYKGCDVLSWAPLTYIVIVFLSLRFCPFMPHTLIFHLFCYSFIPLETWPLLLCCARDNDTCFCEIICLKKLLCDKLIGSMSMTVGSFLEYLSVAQPNTSCLLRNIHH